MMHRVDISTRVITSTMTAFAMAMLVVMPASAQTAANQGGGHGGGYGLDANTQVGTGGINAAADVPDFNFGNDVVSGNVGDKYFRGNVPYSSSRDFGTRLPSDDQFRFRANSLPSAAGTQFRNPGAINRNVAVYRSFSDVTAGGLQTNQPAVFSLDGGSTLYTTRGIPDGSNDLTTPAAQLNNRARALGGFRNGQQITTMEAAPFIGMRQTTTNLAGEEINTDAALRNAAAARPDYDPAQFDRSMRIDRSTGFNFRSQLSPDEQSQIRSVGEHIGERLMRGVRLEDQTQPRNWAVGGESALGRLNRLVNDPDYDPEEASDGDSAYAKIIADIRQGKEKTADYFRPRINDSNAYQPFAVPSGEELSRARAERQRRMRELGLIGAGGTDLEDFLRDPADEESREDRDADNEQSNEEADDAEMSETQRILADARAILEEIDVDIPEVQTLAGERDSQINGFYRKAEQQMAKGKYFDAEESYRNVLVLDSDQPLAQIGMVNAMMGAGLMRSAAKQLRETLLDHPELITVRYKPTLLPAPKRLVEIEAALRNTMSGDGERAARASLLLAYIGYQTRNAKLTEYGLLIGQTRDARDPIWEVLQRVWLDEQTSNSLELPMIQE